jgi:hypothetical protein
VWTTRPDNGIVLWKHKETKMQYNSLSESKRELAFALKNKVDFFGDLRKSDAFELADFLEKLGFACKVENDTDDEGLTDLNRYLVRFCLEN